MAYAEKQGHYYTLATDGQVSLKYRSNAYNETNADSPFLLSQQAVDVYKAACIAYLPKINTKVKHSINLDEPLPPEKPRVILMDINMPKLNGFQATQAIRAFEKHHGVDPAHIVALTGLGSASAQQEAFSSGVDLFLTKPVRLKELTRVLEEVRNEQANLAHK